MDPLLKLTVIEILKRLDRLEQTVEEALTPCPEDCCAECCACGKFDQPASTPHGSPFWLSVPAPPNKDN